MMQRATWPVEVIAGILRAKGGGAIRKKFLRHTSRRREKCEKKTLTLPSPTKTRARVAEVSLSYKHAGEDSR
jgi:hypothetical protein